MILIVAPYEKSETSLAAIQLARLGLSFGSDVLYATPDRQLRSVDSFWDKRVVRLQNMRLPWYVRKAKKVVWFTGGTYLRYMIDAMSDQPTHVYVTPYSRMSFSEWEAAFSSDVVVGTPLPKDKQVDIENHIQIRPTWKRRAWLHWPSDLSPGTSDWEIKGRRPRILLYCDKSTFQSLSYLRATVIELWGKLGSSHQITLVSFKPWSHYLRRLDLPTWVLHSLTFETMPQLRSLAVQLSQTDCLAIMSLHADFGIVASQAISLGVPVVAPKVAPFCDIVKSGVTGRLVCCDTLSNQYGFLSASVLSSDMCREIVTTASPSSLSVLQHQIQATRGRREELTKSFSDSWRTLLDD